jgi:hypothetical protein
MRALRQIHQNDPPRHATLSVSVEITFAAVHRIHGCLTPGERLAHPRSDDIGMVHRDVQDIQVNVQHRQSSELTPSTVLPSTVISPPARCIMFNSIEQYVLE